MIQLDFLQKNEPDGYYIKTYRRDTLQLLDVPGVYSYHNTFEEAMKEISDNSKKLESKQITILPIIDIGWDGEMPSKL